MALKDSRLEIVLSGKLKKQFKDICDESEISMSDKVREIITHLVRNHARQHTKQAEKI